VVDLRRRLRWRPSLRFRLTLWYTFSLTVILVLLAILVYLQLRRSLMTQVDAALQLAAAQALINVEETDGRLDFLFSETSEQAARRLGDDYVIHLMSPEGAAWATLRGEDDLPTLQGPPTGFASLIYGEDLWRVYSRQVQVGETAGRLQVAQELEPVQRTLLSLRTQMLWGLPLAIILAGLGGYLLATRALRPVDHMISTARSITASDLNQRIDYNGPADELGRLAQTFDDMLDRLQHSFEQERRFTGDAAHELRTPLTALKGQIGVTLSRPRQNAELVATLQNMEEQVDRLIRLSSDLLLLARLDQGEQDAARETIVAADFLPALTDQVRPLAKARSIMLTERIENGLKINGNFDLLVRLFINLLDNAIKYTPPGGRVELWAGNQGQAALVTISDTGPGIADEHLPFLFKRFYRGEPGRARYMSANGKGGAGLGLAIAYEIARAHGGTLTAQNKNGGGATFVVSLPHS
jgi:heavy metal sensor kinase